jgi:hypothetical protein
VILQAAAGAEVVLVTYLSRGLENRNSNSRKAGFPDRLIFLIRKTRRRIDFRRRVNKPIAFSGSNLMVENNICQ